MAAWDNEILSIIYTAFSGLDIQIIDFPVLGVTPDTVSPNIENIYPPASSTIQRTTAIEFDVVDETDLKNVVIWVEISGSWEMVYAGISHGFSPGYSGSSVGTLAGGYHFSVVRSGGWVSSPTFSVLGFDGGGNQT